MERGRVFADFRVSLMDCQFIAKELVDFLEESAACPAFPWGIPLTLHRGPTVRRTPLHQPPNEIVPPRSTCSVAEARRSGSTSRPVNRVLLSAESASRSGSCSASVSSCITIRCPTTGGWAINDSFPCTER